MARGGQRKGKGGEREVATLLQQWWGQLEPGTKFVSTPKSGGWLHNAEFEVSGDVVTTAELFPFSVEVKRNEQWSIERLLAGKASPVWGFWKQCQNDAAKVSKEPMLWFRKNRKPWMVMLREEYVFEVQGVKKPDVVYRGIDVECGAKPVIYLGDKLLSHEPKIFAEEMRHGS